MEISQFAEQVLRSSSLADKLHRPETLTDERPVGAVIPSEPGRPRGLRMDASRRPVKFPGPQALVRPQGRGLAFHFFANHELLALELMAVALLRFTGAPAAFRRQIAQAMLEEQEHLAAYLEHMPRYGVAFGDVAVSPFFWNALAGMASPMEYIAGMSLTFEQANLDFATRFRDAFSAVEDHTGAAVLQKVLDDEIGHVRLGVQWSRRLGDPDRSDLERHREALRWPLHLGRAKGADVPLVGPRKKAGLSQAYIDALSCVQDSKGRAPALWAFNPDYERELAGCGQGKAAAQVQDDLGYVLSYLCTSGDLVGVTRLPSIGFIKQMGELGFPRAQLLEVPHWPAAWPACDVRAPKLQALHTWGPSAQAERVFGPLHRRARVGLPAPSARAASAALSRKTVAADLHAQFVATLPACLRARLCLDGHEVRSMSELLEAISQSHGPDATTWVLKAPLGTAGRHQQKVDAGTLSTAQSNWARKLLRQQGAIRVEPWRHRVLDLSARYAPAHPGQRRTRTGCTRQLCDAQGAFLGHVLTALGAGLDRPCIDFIYDRGTDAGWIPRLYDRLERWLGDHPEFGAYRGPLGFDAMVCKDAGQLRLRLMLEINARYTMGHVADAIARRVLRGRAGLWLQLSRADLRRAGWSSFAQAADALPTQVVSQGQALASGRCWTTDPTCAGQLATILLVDKTLEAALLRLGPLAPGFRERIEGGSGDVWAPACSSGPVGREA